MKEAKLLDEQKEILSRNTEKFLFLRDCL